LYWAGCGHLCPGPARHPDPDGAALDYPDADRLAGATNFNNDPNLDPSYRDDHRYFNPDSDAHPYLYADPHRHAYTNAHLYSHIDSYDDFHPHLDANSHAIPDYHPSRRQSLRRLRSREYP
jgi:hypothetical protein